MVAAGPLPDRLPQFVTLTPNASTNYNKIVTIHRDLLAFLANVVRKLISSRKCSNLFVVNLKKMSQNITLDIDDFMVNPTAIRIYHKK